MPDWFGHTPKRCLVYHTYTHFYYLRSVFCYYKNMPRKEQLGTTKNGKRVYVELRRSHVTIHLRSTPDLLDLVRECIANLIVEKPNVYVDYDMRRIVGQASLVNTNPNDDIVYAKRQGRQNYARFVRHRKAVPTRYVTVALQAEPKGEYVLLSAWLGQAVPQFPGDRFETPESHAFWRSHALIWGSQSIQAGTETTVWPWSRQRLITLTAVPQIPSTHRQDDDNSTTQNITS